MNGNGWNHFWTALALGAAGFACGMLWTLHGNDSAQTQRLDEFARRAEVVRGTIVDALERLTKLEHEFDLHRQREEARP